MAFIAPANEDRSKKETPMERSNKGVKRPYGHSMHTKTGAGQPAVRSSEICPDETNGGEGKRDFEITPFLEVNFLLEALSHPGPDFF
jgi:hypothetical protein